MSSQLILSCLDESRSNNHQVILLGHWCLRKEDQLNEEASNKINPYHWDSVEKLKSDIDYIDNLYQSILEDLTDELNLLHSSNLSIRGWRIILEPWLKRCISILFDRFETIRSAVENHDIGKVNCLRVNRGDLLAKDRNEFWLQYKSHDWNYRLYSRILRDTTDITINEKELAIADFRIVQDKKQKVERANPIKWLYRKLIESSFVNRLFFFLFSNSKYFIFTTYIPGKLNNLKLNLLLANMPVIQNFGSKVEIDAEPDFDMRDKLNLDRRTSDKFESYLRELLPDLIPVIYIEGFPELRKKAHILRLPVAPEVIFTTIGIYTNEVIKYWLAKKVSSGAKLVVGQHGGNYGTFFVTNEALPHELAVSDYYFSWGWQLPGQKIIPVPALKIIGKKEKAWNRHGNLLIVTRHLNQYCEQQLLLPGRRNIHYFNRIASLAENLSDHEPSNVMVRLHNFKNSAIEQGIPVREKLQDRVPGVQISLDKPRLSTLIDNSKLTFFTYDGTPFLENMGLNKPSILISDEDFDPFSELAKPFYYLLASVGIYHHSVESAVEHYKKVQDDILGWWQSDEVVSVKKEFCKNFARTSNNPIYDIACELKKIRQGGDTF